MKVVSHAPDSLERVWYFTVERFVPAPQNNWEVLIGQSGQQCKLHIITLSRSQFYAYYISRIKLCASIILYYA